MVNSTKGKNNIKEPELTTTVLDKLALKVLESLTNRNLLPDNSKNFNWKHFHKLRNKARKKFVVPETSITPFMARVLFGITAYYRPTRILAIGTYVGNSLLFLLGPYLLTNSPKLKYAYGIDIDQKATRIAKSNFKALGAPFKKIKILAEDGLTFPNILQKEFDLVYIDVDDQILRKKIYIQILKNVYPFIKKNGIVLAHDICIPKFKEDLSSYLNYVKDKRLFKNTQSLEIDYCGLEISKRA
jgi:predicted O-methyltransferase YrrM